MNRRASTGSPRSAGVRLAWLLWLACAGFLWLFWLASVPTFLDRAAAGALPTTVANGLAPAQVAADGAAAWGVGLLTWAWINTAVNGLTFLAFSLAAGLIGWRVRTGYGMLTAFVLLLGGSSFMGTAIYGARLSTTALSAWELGAVVWPFFFPWLYLFPNGRAVPRRLLWLLGPLMALFAGLFLVNLLATFAGAGPALTRLLARLEQVIDPLIVLLFGLVIGAQVYRYVRESGAAEQRQTRWFLFGLLVAILPTGLLSLVGTYPAELDAVTFAAIPMGIGISILRYRLWDIDLIIRKTLVYAVLSGLLVLVYFGLVVSLQAVFDAVSSQQSPVVIVMSTLAIAALAAPLRRQVQAVIDRRFYRQRYDAQQVLARFAQTARDEVSLRALTAELTDVVQTAVQPERVGIWLK